MKLITPENPCFSYMGRIDFENPAKPIFIYAGSMLKIKFTGASVAVKLRNIPMSERYWIGAMVDGIQYKIELDSSAEKIYPICGWLETDKEHELVIFKREAAAHYFEFLGIMLDDNAEVSSFSSDYKLKLEVYGDSVSAGEVVEALNFEAHQDPPDHKGFYDNSWFSYPLSLARKLGAEVYDNSQGGLSLFDKTGWFNGPDNLTGLETTFDKLSYVSYSPKGYTNWDFSRYTPDYIIIAIGQNDANPDPDAIKDSAYARRWKDKYIEIMRKLHSEYNNPRFILITTVLMHDPIWDDTIDEISKEVAEKYGISAKHYLFRRNGAATPGHPRVTEQEEMASELAAFITEWNNK